MALSYRQVYQLARGAGLGKEAAITATAIAAAESAMDPNAVGDTTLTDATWGPSIGLWQIRSLKAETGTGKSRDASRLKDPKFNARSMVAISSHGSSWTPWSVYTSGSYRGNLDAARAAARGDREPEAPSPPAPPSGQNADPAGDWPSPFPGDDGLPGYGDDLLGDLGGKAAGSAAGAAAAELLAVGARILPYLAALTIGVALIGVGAWNTGKAAS